MAKISQKKSLKNTTNTSASCAKSTATPSKVVKRKRKSIPKGSPPQRRSSIYRGVTRHRWTGRYEAHLWDKNGWNESQSKKGRQVYLELKVVGSYWAQFNVSMWCLLGAYDDEEAAARAYDLAALKYWGQDTILNFPLSNYQEELKDMEGQSKEEYIGSLRRKSSGFSRGVSKFRGVARHHHNGRWEARIGRVFGNKYLYLGTYATQEEAAMAYDMAAIEYRGLNAVTNFDLSHYINWLRPKIQDNQENPSNQELDSTSEPELGFISGSTTGGIMPENLAQSSIGGASKSSALGLLLQSSKFKEMLQRTPVEDYPPEPLESNPPRRTFPEDIQTFFETQDSDAYTESDDIIFGDLGSFGPPIFHFEFDA